MDTTEFSESQYISAEVVKNSPTRTAIILDEAMGEKTDFGTKLVCNVQLDGRTKKWRMNKDSVKGLQDAFGKDSKTWIGQQVRLMTVVIKGKDSVVGVPMLAPAVKQENIA